MGLLASSTGGTSLAAREYEAVGSLAAALAPRRRLVRTKQRAWLQAHKQGLASLVSSMSRSSAAFTYVAAGLLASHIGTSSAAREYVEVGLLASHIGTSSAAREYVAGRSLASP